MPEPGEVRDGLVWTGSEWVPLKQGVTPEASEQPKSESELGVSLTSIVCPHCHERDQLVKVSGLLDKSQTSETSYTFGTGIAVGTGGIGVGMGDAITDTQGTNALAERFKLPSPTIYGGCWISGIAFIIILVLVGLLMLIGLDGGTVASIIVMIPILAGGYLYWKYLKFEKVWRKINEKALSRMRDGYYCQRCDLAFEVGAKEAVTPEDYKTRILATYDDELNAAASQVPILSRFFRA